MSQDFLAIIETVEAYFDGTKQGSRTLLEKAFYPTATLKTASPSGDYAQMALEEFVNFVQQRGTSCHTTEIISVEQADNIAMVKVMMNFETHSFIDFLSLIKVKEEWKIVDKLYNKYQKNS
ncbi:MAG: nuclear transport factor 2 family protein [Microcystaceae cyanobacterium]